MEGKKKEKEKGPSGGEERQERRSKRRKENEKNKEKELRPSSTQITLPHLRQLVNGSTNTWSR